MAKVTPEGKFAALRDLKAQGTLGLAGDRIGDAIGLSCGTVRNIWQSVFRAVADGAALIPVAAGVLCPAFDIRLPPALSSVVVLTSALRLKRSAPVAYRPR